MIEQQQKLVLSPYMEIYELVIPKDNLLRQIKELVDFSEYYGAAEPPVRCGESHLSGLTEPPHFVY